MKLRYFALPIAFALSTVTATTLAEAMPKAVPIAAPIVMHAALTVPQEASQTSPQTPAQAVGSSSYLYNPKSHVLSYAISFAGLSSAPFMAHFHLGSATTNGPVVQTICGKPKPSLMGDKPCAMNNYGMLVGQWHVPDQYVKDLLQGRIYVNIHTQLNKGGVIRGQLLPGR